MLQTPPDRVLLLDTLLKIVPIDKLDDIIDSALGFPWTGPGAAPAPRDRLDQVIRALEGDGFERWVFPYFLKYSVESYRSTRTLFDACPSALRDLKEVRGILETVMPQFESQISLAARDKPDILNTLAALRRKLSRDVLALKLLTITLSFMCKLRVALTELASRISRDPAIKHVLIHNSEISLILDAIEEIITTFPAGPAEANDNKQWILKTKDIVTRVRAKIQSSDLDTAATEVNRILTKQVHRLATELFKLVKTIRLVDLPSVAMASPSALSIPFGDVKLTILGRVLTCIHWHSVEIEFLLLFGLYSDEDPIILEDLATNWLNLKERVLWLSSLEAEGDVQKEMTSAIKDINDLLGSSKRFDETLRSRISDLIKAIRKQMSSISQMLNEDSKALKPIMRGE
ncbi:hypothetical protein [Mesorhizobium sp.]|uniref:hypothetical protein n=1 Tax=Mesorhizobium sp. TaxID=1871066 RepID=UPI001225C330|nr:hypothetical protein [Mesorhizobium sp.]TIL42778.1 MAG: hypothetical protein E5Y86_25565 [Mesorhizobium sp.]